MGLIYIHNIRPVLITTNSFMAADDPGLGAVVVEENIFRLRKSSGSSPCTFASV